MNTCAVTIAGPDRRVDLVVSTETPISELIPTFVELSMDEAPPHNGRTPRVDASRSPATSRCRWTARSASAASPTARCWR